MFSFFSTSHFVGKGLLESTPLACGPRNCVQFPTFNSAPESKTPTEHRKTVPTNILKAFINPDIDASMEASQQKNGDLDYC